MQDADKFSAHYISDRPIYIFMLASIARTIYILKCQKNVSNILVVFQKA